MARTNIHGTGLVIDGKGILLRGVSGAGKSLLALQLLDDAELRGKSAKLVADDRMELETENGMLVMHAPAQMAGKIELRGCGIIERAHTHSAPLNLVVELVDDMERLVEEDECVTTLEGVDVPACRVAKRGIIDPIHQMILVREALKRLSK